MTKNNIKTYVFSIAIPVLTGFISFLLTMGQMDLYTEIQKPQLAPPAIVFPIVWTVLYILMGISFARILLSDSDAKNKNMSILWYIIQLIFNFFWSIWFFNLRAFEFSFVWILIMWYCIIRMIISFYKSDKLAAYLQIPYLIWVTFAAYLNFMVALLN